MRDDNFVWVEGEIPADIDYNEEAQRNADKDIPDHIPTDGFYLKATNANKEASQADKVGWYVAGAFKPNRIMSDKETRDVIDRWNAEHPGDDKVEYDWKRESGKDFNAETMRLEDTPKFSIRTYHGSGVNSNLESASLVGEVDNHPMLNAIHTLYTKGKDFAAKLFNMKYFDVAKTPDFMKEVGLTGDKFTVRYGVMSRHFGKDGSHNFTEEEWQQLPGAIQNPFAISKLSDKKDGYRIYTTLKTEKGEYVVVGADVKNAGRNLEVNSIATIFGRRNDANLPKNENVIYKSKEITPEQMALLSQPNSDQYPSTQELSAAKIDNSSETAKENGEKFSLKDTKLEKIGDNIYRFTPAKSKESTYMDANGNQLHAVKFETIKGKKWYEGFHAPKDLDIKKVDGKYEVEYLFGTYDNLDDAVEQLGKLYDQSRFRKVGDGIQAEFQDKGIVKPAKVVKFVTKEQADTISMLTGKSLADVIDMKTKFSLKDEKTLVGVHNITEDKLRKALNQGGLANPSVAIVDSAKQIHEGYGGISLIMPNQMIAKRTGQNAGTFFGDAWTPSYPHVERQLGKNGYSAMREDIDKLPSGMQSLMQSAMQSYLDGRNEDGLAYMFLSETGRKPEMVKRESEYSDEEIAKVGKLTNGTYDTEGLSEESKQALFDLYLQHKGKTRKEWDESVEPMKANLRETLKNTKEGSFPHNRAEMNLAQLEEYGYFPKNVNALVNGVRTAKAISGTADYYGTSDAAMKRVREDGLTKEYNKWLAEKDERYGIKEVIFDGYTPSGNRKYVPNDLKHVSQLMKKAGRNGAEGSGFSFNSFVAEALQSTGNLDKIRARKSQLTNDHADIDAFTDKWSDTYIHLASAVNPEGGDVFNDTGYARLKEMAGQRNPVAYAKKEYGVSLSEKDAKQFNDMLAAIREERPTMYFETKFERPVMFNEFSAAVVPSDMDADVRKGLEATGLRLYDYDASKEGDRQRAFVEAINGGEDIRFSLKDTKPERIEKLRQSKPIEITGKEITPSDDLKQYKKNALEYGKTLRGTYTNEDTGEVIDLTGGNKRGGIREILQHDYKDIEHLQSIAAIPQIIEKSVFIDELPNEDKQHYPDVKSFRYYVCGLKIDGKDYTVKAVVAEQNNGNRYYDHRLTDIEKGKLLSIIPTIQKAGIDGNLPKSAYKDKRLISILQTNEEESSSEPKFSLRVDQYQHDLAQWKKDNNLPKDAERPAIPVREPNETAVDFANRVKEYRRQMALWKTAPQYEDHLLTDDTAQGQFNLELQRGSVLARIALQDSMLAVRKAQEAIMKEVGVDRLNIAEDAYTAENRSHGKGKNEFEEYNDEFLQPLRKAYNRMMKNLGKSYDKVKIYMVAKHGLERNAHIAFKKAMDKDFDKQADRIAAYNAYKADMDRMNNDIDFEAGRIDFTTWRQKDNAIRTKYAPSYLNYRYDKMGIAQDYSGLSALFEGSDFEEAAAEMVKDVETQFPNAAADLWQETNAATKKILRDSYKAGMMTKEVYDYVRGMYQYYIPLRGWGDTNADQVWNYMGGGKGAFSQTLKKANGRKSLADDPIAYIENMAESGILMNNKNWVKQHLLLLAENHPTSLLNVSKAWYIKTIDAQGNEEWIPASPNITANMNSQQVKNELEAFEQKMEQMKQKGDATQKREHLEIKHFFCYPQVWVTAG